MTEPPSEPPSDPGPAFDDDDTRKIVLRLAKAQTKAAGAATAWRTVGGIAVTVGLALAAAGLAYAQQAAVDHERVGRLESDVGAMRGDLAEIRASQATAAQALARIEGRLSRGE